MAFLAHEGGKKSIFSNNKSRMQNLSEAIVAMIMFLISTKSWGNRKHCYARKLETPDEENAVFEGNSFISNGCH